MHDESAAPPAEKSAPFDLPRLALALDSIATLLILAIAGLLIHGIVKARQQISPLSVVTDSIEIQDLRVDSTSPGLKSLVQDTHTFPFGKWRNDNQFLVQSHATDSWIRFKLPTQSGRRYQLVLFLTRSYDFGIIQIAIGGKALGRPIDLWDPNPTTTGPLDVGEFTSAGSTALLEFRVVGTNHNSVAPYYQFGIDGLTLRPLPFTAGGKR